MLKVFLLIFDPSPTWEKIDAEQRSVAYLAGTVLLPLILLSAVVEAFLLSSFGRTIGPLDSLQQVATDVIIRYEITFVLLTLLIVFGGSALLANMGDTFHSRQTFQGCFTTLAYSISPLLLLRMLGGFPALSSWIGYAIGIIFTISHLYRGVPRTLKPEPTNALGVYLFCTVFVLIATGLAHYVGILVLDEQILSDSPSF